jgi:hypothetical protein
MSADVKDKCLVVTRDDLRVALKDGEMVGQWVVMTGDV